jgi:hypothetical protein
VPIAQTSASASAISDYVSSGTLSKEPKSGIMMFECLGEEEARGRRARVVIRVMEGWWKQDWRIALPIAPLALTTRSFIEMLLLR